MIASISSTTDATNTHKKEKEVRSEFVVTFRSPIRPLSLSYVKMLCSLRIHSEHFPAICQTSLFATNIIAHKDLRVRRNSKEALKENHPRKVPITCKNERGIQ